MVVLPCNPEFAKIGTALMLANYVSEPDFNLKMRKSQLTVLAIIGVPALVVLSIPDVGSLLVFTAFAIALYREGLNGWLFIVGFVLAAVFLLSIAFNPLYITGVLVGLVLILFSLIIKNSLECSYNSHHCRKFGNFSRHQFWNPKIMEKKLPKHQRERIEVLYKGEKAFRDTSGYNLLYSKTAIGSGGFWEKVINKVR